MKVGIKPYYRIKPCFINTDEPFTESFDYETTINTCYFKAGFNLFLIDEDCDEEDIVATVEGYFFNYNYIEAYDINIIDSADTISSDAYNAIVTLKNNNFLLAEVDIGCRPLICYLSRFYIYPNYRNNGIATYIHENLQEIFEYVTSDLTSIFIILPCPQEPTSDERWQNVKDDIMFEKMVSLLNKHEFKPIGKEGFYYKSYT